MYQDQVQWNVYIHYNSATYISTPSINLAFHYIYDITYTVDITSHARCVTCTTCMLHMSHHMHAMSHHMHAVSHHMHAVSHHMHAASHHVSLHTTVSCTEAHNAANHPMTECYVSLNNNKCKEGLDVIIVKHVHKYIHITQDQCHYLVYPDLTRLICGHFVVR